MGSVFKKIGNLANNAIDSLTGSRPESPAIPQPAAEAPAPAAAPAADTPKTVDTGEEGGDATKARAKGKGKRSVTITRSGGGGSGLNV